jgi:hypothetical protein
MASRFEAAAQNLCAKGAAAAVADQARLMRVWKALHEGHGFSRAIKRRAERASAPEVL